ncbi:hypothetical protein, conserved in T. vivax [Trypanosoma vivax Y486]|uniref:Uncharacterized protein n=1 Tax=Trypanosoma vivax (strain Y486) TaxID=1055687 RepID=F9WR87_TRYVY|nr:hypothetical protein, conserved in T. vivax [Trypanosoma vivax Y486]|eukprot:CCD20071.1 hypothetical protein, conserved in T. vivax [Trypanosoma vivax Y486]
MHVSCPPAPAQPVPLDVPRHKSVVCCVAMFSACRMRVASWVAACLIFVLTVRVRCGACVVASQIFFAVSQFVLTLSAVFASPVDSLSAFQLVPVCSSVGLDPAPFLTTHFFGAHGQSVPAVLPQPLLLPPLWSLHRYIMVAAMPALAASPSCGSCHANCAALCAAMATNPGAVLSSAPASSPILAVFVSFSSASLRAACVCLYVGALIPCCALPVSSPSAARHMGNISGAARSQLSPPCFFATSPLSQSSAFEVALPILRPASSAMPKTLNSSHAARKSPAVPPAAASPSWVHSEQDKQTPSRHRARAVTFMSPSLLLPAHKLPACLAHCWPIDRANAVRGAHVPHASCLPARRLRAVRAACAPSFPVCRCHARSEALGPHVRPLSPCHGRGGALCPPRRADTVTRAHAVGLARTACSVARQAALHPAPRASCARGAGSGTNRCSLRLPSHPGVTVRPLAPVASPRSGGAARGHKCVARRPWRHPFAARTGCARPADAFAQSAGHRIEPVGA